MKTYFFRIPAWTPHGARPHCKSPSKVLTASPTTYAVTLSTALTVLFHIREF